jgi:DNA transformation protein
MSLSDGDADFARELFAGVGPLKTRKMMGGLCIYSGDVIFAMVHSDGKILLKGGDGFGAELEAAGGEHWTYTRKDGKQSSMPYWTLPEAALDDPELACDWARRALAHLQG